MPILTPFSMDNTDPKTKLPDESILTVVLRDWSPMKHSQDPCRYRSVQIKLTPEQLEQLRLEWIYESFDHELKRQAYSYEEISTCFLEKSKS